MSLYYVLEHFKERGVLVNDLPVCVLLVGRVQLLNRSSLLDPSFTIENSSAKVVDGNAGGDIGQA